MPRNPAPWDRRLDESAKAYAAFRAYLQFYEEGNEYPTTAKTAQKIGKSWSLCRKWCTKYNWVARSIAYSSHLLKISLEESERAYRAREREREQNRRRG